jgi:hypothetical protein
MAYQDTPNKALIRQKWDFPILQCWHSKTHKRLDYLGLSGPEIHDILDWKDLLGKVTAVESLGKTKQEREECQMKINQMLLNANIFDVSSGFQVLKADIEDVLLECFDSDNFLPQCNDGQPVHKTRFLYDLVNLDFDGGLGFIKEKDSKVIKRVESIKKLFERQEGKDFVLFLTINVRSTIVNVIENYLRQWKSKDQSLENIIDRYLAQENSSQKYKLKAVVPSFIQSASEQRGFQCKCYPPIVYIGHEQAQMLHFAFEFHFQANSLKGFSTQSDHDLINLPLLESTNGQIIFLPQHPGYANPFDSDPFSFLPRSKNE